MYIKKHWIALSILLIPCIGNAQEIKIDESWLHQSLNVIGRTDSRFGPRLTNDLYPEYTVAGRKDWFDFYGYVDLPKFFGVGSHYDVGIWDEGSPLFTEIEPRFSIDKLTGLNLAFGPFKEWFIANNYVYDMGDNQSSRQSTWYMGLGTDIDTILIAAAGRRRCQYLFTGLVDLRHDPAAFLLIIIISGIKMEGMIGVNAVFKL